MQNEIVIAQTGLTPLLTWMLQANGAPLPDLQLRLFRNTLDPDCEVTLGDIVECDFDGYARVTLNRSQWQAPAVEQCCGIMLYGTVPISWTNVGDPQTVWGYVLHEPASNTLIAIQAQSEGIDVPSFGTLSIRPQFTLTSGACEPLA